MFDRFYIEDKMNYQETLEYLNSFVNFEYKLKDLASSELKLDRIVSLLEALGNPQNKLNIIHVAGSKGKGSVCAFTAQILKEAGFKVGLYTSPHINCLRERIRLLSFRHVKRPDDLFSDQINEEEFARLVSEMRTVIDQQNERSKHGRLSFFEILTALALYYFYQRGADFVVLETGLGGRLDATNAVNALVSVITPISLEHTQILGSTVREIAGEKAAIIKPSTKRVVVAAQEEDAADVIKGRCSALNKKGKFIGEDLTYQRIYQNLYKEVFRIETKRTFYFNLTIPLIGTHQLENATVAFGVIESLRELGYDVDDWAISHGMANVQWPGRFEVIHKSPYVIIDGAHNGASMANLVRTFKGLFPNCLATVIAGFSHDKDIKSICEELLPIAQRVVVTRSQHPKAADLSAEEIKNLFPFISRVKISNIEESIQSVLHNAGPDDVVLITGSLYVVSEARKILVSDLRPATSH